MAFPIDTADVKPQPTFNTQPPAVETAEFPDIELPRFSFRRPTISAPTVSRAVSPTVSPNLRDLGIPRRPAPVPSKAAPVPSKAAPVPPKAAPVPPKAAPVPSKAAPVPPKAAPVPSKATPVPPKAAPVPPKATPVPPKAAPVPPKAAPVPPKAAPTPQPALDIADEPLGIVDVVDVDSFEAFPEPLEIDSLTDTSPLELQVLPAITGTPAESVSNNSLKSDATSAKEPKTKMIIAGVLGAAVLGAAVYFLRDRK